MHCAPGLSLPYRPPILSIEAKLADMDAAGIDLAVLSHGLPGPHVLGGAQADLWAARINDELAAISATHPGRFAGWASLGSAPLEYCYAQLGAGRLLFGTDHPYAAPGLPQDLIDCLPCTQAEHEQILAGNAQRLLRLNAAVAGRARDGSSLGSVTGSAAPVTARLGVSRSSARRRWPSRRGRTPRFLRRTCRS
jgi:hypothetical protein